MHIVSIPYYTLELLDDNTVEVQPREKTGRPTNGNSYVRSRARNNIVKKTHLLLNNIHCSKFLPRD